MKKNSQDHSQIASRYQAMEDTQIIQEQQPIAQNHQQKDNAQHVVPAQRHNNLSSSPTNYSQDDDENMTNDSNYQNLNSHQNRQMTQQTHLKKIQQPVESMQIEEDLQQCQGQQQTLYLNQTQNRQIPVPVESSEEQQDTGLQAIYKKTLDLDTLFSYIDNGNRSALSVKNKHLVMLIGKTGSGKTTIANFMLGRQMHTVVKQLQVEANGRFHQIEKTVIDAVNPHPDFIVGHEKISKTILISCAQPPYSELWLVDTPGFEDSRNAETDTANSVSINSAMQVSSSVRPILVLSYIELQDPKGNGLRQTLNIINKFFKNLLQCQKHFIIIFTNVPAGDQMKIVKNEILQFIQACKDDAKQQDILQFLNYIFDQCEIGAAYIINLLADDPSRLWKMIETRQQLDKPSQYFSYCLSNQSLALLKEFCDGTRILIQNHKYQNNYKNVSACLSVLQKFYQYIQNDYIKSTLDSCIQEVKQQIGEETQQTLIKFEEALQPGNQLTHGLVKEVLKCIKNLNQIGKLECQLLADIQQSEEMFLKSLQKSCELMQQQCNRGQNLQTFDSFVEAFLKIRLITQSIQDGKLYQIMQELEGSLVQVPTDLAKQVQNMFKNIVRQVDTKSLEQIESDFSEQINQTQNILGSLLSMQNKCQQDLDLKKVESHNQAFTYMKDYTSKVVDELKEQIFYIIAKTGRECDEIIIKSKNRLFLIKLLRENDSFRHTFKNVSELYDSQINLVVDECTKILDKATKIIQSQAITFEANFQDQLKLVDSLRSLDTQVYSKISEKYQQSIFSIRQVYINLKQNIDQIVQKIRNGELDQIENLNDEIIKLQNIQWMDSYFEKGEVSQCLTKINNNINKQLKNLEEICYNQFVRRQNFPILQKNLYNLSELYKISSSGDDSNRPIFTKINQEIQSIVQQFQESFQKIKEKPEFPSQWRDYDQNYSHILELQELSTTMPACKSITVVIGEFKQILYDKIFCVKEQIMGRKSEEIFAKSKEWNNFYGSLKILGEQLKLKELIENYSQLFEHVKISIEQYFDDQLGIYIDYLTHCNLTDAENLYKQLEQVSCHLRCNFPEIHNKFSALDKPQNKQSQIVLDLIQAIKNRKFSENLYKFQQLQSSNNNDNRNIDCIKKFAQQKYENLTTTFCRNFNTHQRYKDLNVVVITNNLAQLSKIEQDLAILLDKNILIQSEQNINNVFINIIQKNKDEIANLCKVKNYFKMEEQLVEFKKLCNFLRQIISTEGITFFERLGQHRLQQQGLSEQGSLENSLNLHNQYEELQGQILKNLNDDEFSLERENISVAKTTLDELLKNKTNRTEFQINYANNYEKLQQQYLNKFQQELIATTDQIKNEQIRIVLDKKDKILSQIKILKPHIERQQFENNLRQLEAKIKQAEDIQKEEFQKLILQENFDNLLRKIDLLKNQGDQENLDKITEQIINTGNSCFEQCNSLLDQKDFCKIIPQLKQIQGIIKYCSQLAGNKQIEKIKQNLTALLHRTPKLINNVIQDFQNKFGKQTIAFTSEQIRHFFSALQLATEFVQQNQIIKQSQIIGEKIKEELYQQILLFKSNYQKNLELKNFKDLVIDLNRAKFMSPFIEFIHQINENDSSLVTIGIELQRISKETLSQLQILEKVQDELEIFKKEFEQLWIQQKYQDLKTCLQQLKHADELNRYFQNPIIDKDQVIANLANKIKSLTHHALLFIQNQQFNELQVYFLQVQAAEEVLIDFQGLYTGQQTQIVIKAFENSLKNMLVECDLANLQQFGQKLKTAREILYTAPAFKKQIDQQLDDILEKFVRQNAFEGIYRLSLYLERECGVAGNEIVSSYRQFNSINILNFNKKASITLDYALEHLQRIHQQNNEIIDKQLLKTFYDSYQKEYADTVKRYSPRLAEKNKIAAEMRTEIQQAPLIHQQSTKELMNKFLARIFAYWTLLQIGEKISYDLQEQMILKQPNFTQVLSIMMLLGFDQADSQQVQVNIQPQLQNHLIEILTGEGKSIVLGILATLLAFMGLHVDVVCYSDYLSKRDYENFKPIFQAFEVEARIYYGTLDTITDLIINQGGDVREITKKLIKGTSERINSIGRVKKSILLIDEVDIFFGKSFYGNSYIPTCCIKNKLVKAIAMKIWEQRNLQTVQNKQNILNSEQFKTLLQKYPKWKNIIKNNIEKMIDDVSNFKQFDYEIVDDQIGYKQHDSIKHTIFYGYTTMFAYFYECEQNRITEQSRDQQISLNITCGEYSYAEIPTHYQNILGVSGTLKSLDQQMLKNIQEQYKIDKLSIVPSMFGRSNLQHNQVEDIFVEEDMQNKEIRIQRITDQKIKDKQAVLIIFSSKEELMRYYNSNHLATEKSKYLLLTESTKDKSDIVRRSTHSQSVTLVVSDLGRGTDFACSDKEVTREQFGVVVIQTFFAKDLAEEMQIKGRTARQGYPGQYYMVLLEEDLQNKFLITKQQIGEQIQSRQLYKFLDEKRQEQQKNKLKLQYQKVKEAKKSHEKMLKYIQCLEQGQFERAEQHIKNMNQ